MIDWKNKTQKALCAEGSAAPLVGFRIFFGFMMLLSVLRFVANGWVEALYLEPEFHFTYFGFSWVKAFGPVGMYLVFAGMALAALGILLGYFYRWSAAVFFLLFTYVELLDKTTYLNHYYFVSLVAFIMIWLPANRAWSLDVWRKPGLKLDRIPKWTIWILQLQLGLVYVFAGLAKLNSDWLVEAMPLKIWLPAHTDLAVIGPLFDQEWVAYAFSWAGALYDLTIPFFLLYRPTRLLAYSAVFAFHLLTWLLFPIGMFPFIMMGATLIFFSADWHERIVNGLWRIPQPGIISGNTTSRPFVVHRWGLGLLGLFLLLQVAVPLRYLAYPGDLFWTEEGYRFSWRVMLTEKAGYVTFKVRDPESGNEGEVDPSDHLTVFQEKQMSTQPDMILEFAHHVAELYKKQGIANPEVRAEAFVTLNGHRSRLLIDPTVDLAKEKDTFAPKFWILPFEQSPKLGSTK